MKFDSFNEVTDWKGFYSAPVNKESYYHVQANGKLFLVWEDPYLGIREKCSAIMTPQLRKLSQAINNTKRQFSSLHKTGGRFVINEFGYVIVPYYCEDYTGYFPKVIGKFDGLIEFNSPSSSDTFLMHKKNLKTGDDWNLPYVGSKYNLAGNDYIYFWNRDASGGESRILPQTYTKLISKLRKLRPERKPVRFIVNNYGIVLTKVEEDSIWKAKFVCYLDYSKWFTEEQVSNSLTLSER